jgi:multiple sugar transport system permease protein
MTTNIPLQESVTPTTKFPTLAKRTFWQQVGHDIRKSNKWGYVFIAPLVIDFAIFTVYLLVHAFMYSLQDIEYGKSLWVGLENFRVMLNTPAFFYSLKNTMVYVILTVPGGILLAVIFSEFIFRRSPAVQSFYKSAYYLPVVVSSVALALVWVFIYQPFYGILNFVTGLFGIAPINWLGNPSTAMLALVAMNIIQGLGGSIVFITAAMGGISTEIYDSAKIDGASEWQRLWRVTVPLLRPTLLYLFVSGFIGNFQVFDQVYVMTAGGPGYPGSTLTIGYLIYSAAFSSFNIGMAAAESVALFVVIAIVSVFQFRFFSGGSEY